MFTGRWEPVLSMDGLSPFDATTWCAGADRKAAPFLWAWVREGREAGNFVGSAAVSQVL